MEISEFVANKLMDTECHEIRYIGTHLEFYVSEEINGFYIEGRTFGIIEDSWVEDGVQHYQVTNTEKTCSRIVTEDQII